MGEEYVVQLHLKIERKGTTVAHSKWSARERRETVKQSETGEEGEAPWAQLNLWGREIGRAHV